MRSKSRLKSHNSPPVSHLVVNDCSILGPSFSPNPTAEFPQQLVIKLLSFVCPHAQDGSYIPCEESMLDGGCMLCDMRDLAQCASVNNQWGGLAEKLL